MRIALALFVIAACGKSSPEKSPQGDRGAEPVGGQPMPGNAGSAPPANQPIPETAIGSASASIIAQQARIAREGDAGVPPSELPPDLGSGAGSGPAGTITITSKTSFDRTNLSADAVAEKIMKEHLASLGACYRASLARDASISGKATLSLTVKPDGTLANTEITAPAVPLQDCFGKAIQSWTFPAPKNAKGEATNAAFQIAFALAPE